MVFDPSRAINNRAMRPGNAGKRLFGETGTLVRRSRASKMKL